VARGCTGQSSSAGAPAGCRLRTPADPSSHLTSKKATNCCRAVCGRVAWYSRGRFGRAGAAAAPMMASGVEQLLRRHRLDRHASKQVLVCLLVAGDRRSSAGTFRCCRLCGTGP
jgi:hypothetical protein